MEKYIIDLLRRLHVQLEETHRYEKWLDADTGKGIHIRAGCTRCRALEDAANAIKREGGHV